LTPEEHETVMLNENAEKIDFSCPADFVGITVTLDVLPRARYIAEQFRKRGIPVVAGGIHVTCSPEDCLPYFDAICIGAAERVWARIIADASEKRLQKVYRDMETLRGDELASPKYDGLDFRKYLYTNIVYASRGCPNRCDFCYNSCRNRAYIQRPVADVLRDIGSLKTRHVLFIDDNFIGVPSYTRELLTAMKGLNLKWSAAVTTKILDYPELLDLMKETGCQSLFIGFESLNNTALKGVNKDNQFEKYERLVEAIHSRGIMINASMVFGLDGDDSDVFSKTLDWLVKNRIETLTSHILTPYPGTVLYRRMEEAGRITERDLSHYNTAHVVFEPKGMTAEQLYDGYLWMYRQFYSFRNIIRRFPRQKAQRKSYFLFNVCYRKFGSLTSALSRLIPMQVLGRIAAWISYRT
ncbi:MAG: radical SAM protein, partial [Oscillospiraceae bacterium]